MKFLTVRNGRQAIVAILIVSTMIVAAVYLASLPVTEPGGSVDPKETLVGPD
ncbi:hypothetical protein J2Y48_002306 [Mycoplana sp. BE70]|uniref:hypothetical protein n=1 Tax=Mycoplana sp. BE70 TaxID=2817775 RepID=UPI002857EF5B|nr:hypothetical protein [Mycoplana sp. BE70]MDR6757010.1 hypothetical protein [Mycoplana sp. BE70]